MSNSPTQKTLALYRSLGYLCSVAEKWNPFAKIRQDFLGIVDIIAIGSHTRGVVFIQTTSSSNHSDRVKKLLASPASIRILESGSRLHVASWGTRRRVDAFFLDDKGGLSIREVENPDEDIGIIRAGHGNQMPWTQL